jgi:hypothetical protein
LAALIYTAEPLWGGLFAYMVLAERWGPMGWVGAALIITASLASQLSGAASKPAGPLDSVLSFPCRLVSASKVPLPCCLASVISLPKSFGLRYSPTMFIGLCYSPDVLEIVKQSHGVVFKRGQIVKRLCGVVFKSL